MNAKEIAEKYQSLQSNICATLEEADGKGKFIIDIWNRTGGGGGITRILNNGNIIEKAGVNFSHVFGKVTENMKEKLHIDGEQFIATGISSIIHPKNPWVPIIHMNVRFFTIDDKICWFGGGIDLTPHYIFPEDAKEFHITLKEICDKYDLSFYPKFKTWADDYFFIPHREETRGVGGIFFDHLKPNKTHSISNIFAFTEDLTKAYPVIYSNLMKKHGDKAYTDKQKEWQLLRRSRYVEFNLVYDRGTKFGLETNGRTESILVSMPPQAKWEYNYSPEPNSIEKQTQDLLKKGIDWINYSN